jgi:hypothetical protein
MLPTFIPLYVVPESGATDGGVTLSPKLEPLLMLDASDGVLHALKLSPQRFRLHSQIV